MSKNHFEQFGLSKEIIEALTMLGYTTPTSIQQEAIPPALAGKNVVAKSKTGSGKTAAFAIPIVELVDWEENAPQAIVLEPTRELAYQVRDEIFHIGRKKRIKVPVVFGGFPIEKQVITLKQKSHVVVGTPGRMLDHLQKGTIRFDKVKYFILDEADLMLDMGFFEDVKQIMTYLPKDRTMMLFSATMGEHVTNLVKEYMENPVEITIASETQTVDTIRQEYFRVENEEKFSLLLEVLAVESPESGMIFAATREMVNVLFRQLKKERIRCGMLHGMVDQEERIRTIEEFREGRFGLLIATDVAARGVDFDNITHVINYDMPMSKETYVHRIGRTGRNGKSGKAISFAQEKELRLMGQIEGFTGATVEEKSGYTKEELEGKKASYLKKQKEKPSLKKKKGAVFQKEITKLSIGGGRKSKIRATDIVGTICSIEGVQSEDIGIIDVRDSLTYVEILNGKGGQVLRALQEKTIKGKVRKVRITK